VYYLTAFGYEVGTVNILKNAGMSIKDIVCACTPFGKPDNNWRPE
jgi:hypothetical protein